DLGRTAAGAGAKSRFQDAILRALRANASGVRSNCPGPLRRGLFALSPTPSESLNLSLPAARSPFSSIPYAEVRVSSTT
ncbi:MAG: hypothetical protein ACLSUK_24930, partial [Hungatella sp.]